MILINQSAKMLKPSINDGKALLEACEYAGRNCYASQDRITDDSCFTFIGNLLKRGHEGPLEFGDITFDLTTSRAVLAEITRHRLASFCVESQRYIQEAKTGDITFIVPQWISFEKDTMSLISNKGKAAFIWYRNTQDAEDAYKALISEGCAPEEAREVLPNSTACRIIMKANLREWRHFFTLRCAKAAYPQMRSLATQMLELAHDAIPVVFDDLYDLYINKSENA